MEMARTVEAGERQLWDLSPNYDRLSAVTLTYVRLANGHAYNGHAYNGHAYIAQTQHCREALNLFAFALLTLRMRSRQAALPFLSLKVTMLG